MTATHDVPPLADRDTVTERLSRLDAPEAVDLPEAIQEIIIATGEQSVRALALNPDGLIRLFGYLGPLMDATSGALPVVERYLIASVVAGQNRCISCFLTNTHELGEHIGDVERARRIAINYRNVRLTPREREIARYAAKLTSTPWDVDDDDVTALREVGLSDPEIYGVMETTAAFNYTTRMSNALGITPTVKH